MNMNVTSGKTRRALGWIELVGLGTIAAATLTTVAARTETPVPTALSVPTGNKLLLQVAAEGVQIYLCQPVEQTSQPSQPGQTAPAAQYEWKLKAPSAELLEDGDRVGTHYGGPTWEYNDGSRVVGELVQRVDAPESDSIPWLLLKAKSHEGDGLFSQVTYIQRLHTSGGKAPVGGCDRTTVNRETEVQYTADYYYYTAQ